MKSEKKLVLIADDDTDYLEQLKFHVENFGFDTLTATNEGECIEAMNERKPDLAIFDLMMKLPY